jgi:hypothetical protein
MRLHSGLLSCTVVHETICLTKNYSMKQACSQISRKVAKKLGGEEENISLRIAHLKQALEVSYSPVIYEFVTLNYRNVFTYVL